jgi:AAA domain-containing protein
MIFQFAPAKRDNVSILIALAGASGSGKTYSALTLAKGLSPTGKIAFIDTEARRGLHYAEEFQFVHADMRPPFAPPRFIEAIRSAEATGAEVVIIDSFSHEYDGEGGIIDFADRLASEGVKSPGNWKEPKLSHKKMMNALLQCHASVIFCLRADEKIEILREGGKTVVRPLGWMPICEKRFLYEMTASFTLTPDKPGVPHFDLPHKLQRQHRGFFSDQKPISEDSGRMLYEWARGGSPSPQPVVNSAAASIPSQVNGVAADDIPTAAEYLLRWDATIKAATDADKLAQLWNFQKPMRNKIVWKDDSDRIALQARVTKAIESMRTPA